jgi:hypothetical protein
LRLTGCAARRVSATGSCGGETSVSFARWRLTSANLSAKMLPIAPTFSSA